MHTLEMLPAMEGETTNTRQNSCSLGCKSLTSTIPVYFHGYVLLDNTITLLATDFFVKYMYLDFCKFFYLLAHKIIHEGGTILLKKISNF